MKIHFKNNTEWKGSLKFYITSFSHNDYDLLNIDRAGRIISFITGNGSKTKTTYKKAFDGHWIGISRDSSDSQRERFDVPLEQVHEIYESINDFIRNLMQLLSKFELWIINLDQNDAYFGYSPKEVILFWSKILSNISINDNSRDSMVFSSVYSNIGILPPDRYGSLVIQITIGCVYNKCAFCSLYQDIKYRHKSPNEVQKHIQEIDEFMGESLGRFHSIFLGDANALTIPYKDLLNTFNIINDRYYFSTSKISFLEKSKPTFEGIYSFLDVFTGFKLSADQFIQLKKLNLKMVYLGIESGSSSVLKLYNKPNTFDKIIQLTNALHQANIGISVIFLIGAGGKVYEKEHTEESIQLIKSLNLTAQDIIYLSKLYIYENSTFKEAMKQSNIKPLNEQELQNQYDRFKSELNNFYKSNKPIITKYEILDFIY